MTREHAPAWAAGLNAEQRRAVEHGDGPLMILAGAGTGKTKTLVSRLARLLDDGVRPERILLVTFSRRAADELVRRVGALTDPAVAAQVDAGTFHAVAHRTLCRYGASVGLGEGFTVVDQGDAVELLALVRSEVVAEAVGGPRRRFARADTLASVYSRVVNAEAPLDSVLVRFFPWCAEDREGIGEVFTRYTARKRAGFLLDFDDLLHYWRAAVTDPTLGPVLAARYDHVLVDEYQDTNLVQSDILRRLCQGDTRVTVVGDDAQAIYSFRAATVRNLLDFPAQFPGTTQVTLTRNYRSTQPVLDLANAVAADLHEGFAKRLEAAIGGGVRPVLATCPDEGAQADAVCDVILEHHERGLALRAQAVLFRTSHHSDLLEVELRRRHIPFVKYGGLRFLEAAHVRDLVALLRILENPWDEMAWYRSLLLLEGLGPATAGRLLADLGVRPRGDGADDPLSRILGSGRPRLPRAEPALSHLLGALAECRGDKLDPG
ncbi:MAG: ATP-dependent helicase, partial [Acidimicrobiales bacterium]